METHKHTQTQKEKYHTQTYTHKQKTPRDNEKPHPRSAFSLETHILNFVCLFLLFCICFTGVFLENKHFVREWGQRHQKGTPKAPQKHPKNKPPILNFVCVFLIKSMCFVGVILGKGHSVREWGQNSKKKFYVFSVFVQKPGSKGDPQITPKSRKTTLEPI